MDTIVVGYDASDAAERALERAASLAEALSARLVIVSVSSPTVPATAPLLERGTDFVPSAVGPVLTGEPMPSPALEERSLEAMDAAQQKLEQARMTLSRRRLEVEYVPEVGSPAERLLGVADDRDADLIVVGSREHGIIERLFARPVDEAVAKRTGRDVLLVH